MIKNKIYSSGQSIVFAIGQSYTLKNDEVFINNTIYRKVDLEIFIQNNSDSSNSNDVFIGIRKRSGNKNLPATLVSYNEWSIDNIQQTSLSLCIENIANLLFYSNSTSSGISFTQQVGQYNDLVAGTNIGDLAYVENSQGTSWLPFSLGGTYYPSGVYRWDGFIWISDRNAIATALDNKVSSVTAGTNVTVTGTATDPVINAIQYDATAIQAEVDLNTAKVTFPEAPNDGTQYARKDLGWEAVAGGGGGGKFVDGTDPLDAVYMDGNVGIKRQPNSGFDLDVNGKAQVNSPTYNDTFSGLSVGTAIRISRKNGPPAFNIYRTNTTGGVNDLIGQLSGQANTNIGILKTFSSFQFYITDPTHNSEIGRISISTLDNGINGERLTVNGSRVGVEITTPQAKLDVNGGIKIADDTDVASVDKVGTFRYRVVNGLGVVQSCVETGALSYAWVNVKTDGRENNIGNVVGATLTLDITAYETFTAVLTEATTIALSNPIIKVVTLDLTGDFAITYPVGSSVVGDTYDGTMNNKIVIEWKSGSIFITVTNY